MSGRRTKAPSRASKQDKINSASRTAQADSNPRATPNKNANGSTDESKTSMTPRSESKDRFDAGFALSPSNDSEHFRSADRRKRENKIRPTELIDEQHLQDIEKFVLANTRYIDVRCMYGIELHAHTYLQTAPSKKSKGVPVKGHHFVKIGVSSSILYDTVRSLLDSRAKKGELLNIEDYLYHKDVVSHPGASSGRFAKLHGGIATAGVQLRILFVAPACSLNQHGDNKTKEAVLREMAGASVPKEWYDKYVDLTGLDGQPSWVGKSEWCVVSDKAFRALCDIKSMVHLERLLRTFKKLDCFGGQTNSSLEFGMLYRPKGARKDRLQELKTFVPWQEEKQEMKSGAKGKFEVVLNTPEKVAQSTSSTSTSANKKQGRTSAAQRKLLLTREESSSDSDE